MLSKYRVLDLCDERGFVASQILGDLGADVIAVEPPAGSPARRLGPFGGGRGLDSSLWWLAYARGKRSVTIDLDDPSGRDNFHALVRSADFLFESFGPGGLEARGIGWDELSRINPRLIVTSVTPFGLEGPKARWPASDLTAWAASGALLLTGNRGRPPVQVGVPQAWLHAGSDAALGALIANEARLRTGRGQRVDVSAQVSSMAATQSWVLPAGWNDAETHRTGGGFELGPLKMRFVYPCADGHVSITFLFGNALGPFTRRLLEWMHEEGFVDDATRDKDWVGYAAALLSGVEPMSELDRVMDEVERFCLAHTKKDLAEGAMRRSVLLAPVTTSREVLESPQLAARDYWTAVPRPDTTGQVTCPGPFARFSATPIRYLLGAPRLGQHNDEVLANLPAHPMPAPARTGQAQHRSALDGLKILDFSWAIAGPAATRALADYGATVVRVESTTRLDSARTFQPFKDGVAGPERSACYGNVNAGKLGLTLNLSRPEAREVAVELAKWADIVVENYSPRAMRKWGLHYDALREVNPTIIMLSSSLNGQDGPLANLAGFGTMAAASGGFHALTGWPDLPPAGPFLAYTDYMAPRYTAAAILAALEHRRDTGEGQYIDLSQTEVSLHFLAPALLDYTLNGVVEPRAGNRSPNFAPHGVYPTVGNDRWVAIAAENDTQWQALCRVIDREDWAADAQLATVAGRLVARDALDDGIAHWTARREVAKIESLLATAGVPVHRVASSADCLGDPQLAARGHFPLVEQPQIGPVPLEAPRFRLLATPAALLQPYPNFGQHNDFVLRTLLGWGDERVAALAATGALE